MWIKSRKENFNGNYCRSNYSQVTGNDTVSSEKDNKILMVKEAKKKCYGKWNVPAGHLEDGETIFEGAIREIFEETGCKVRLKNVLPIMSKDMEDTTLMIITFTTELLEKNISFNKEEILDVKWISKEKLINMTDKELRDEKRIKIILQMLEENKVYPLDAIKILEYIN